MTTDILFLRRCLGETTGEDYIVWAVEQLCGADDTPSLRILAGLNPALDRDEIEEFFLKACSELNLEAPKLDSSIGDRAVQLHAAYARGDLSARALVRVVAGLVRSPDNHSSVEEARDRMALAFWMDMEGELALAGTDYEGTLYPVTLLSRLDDAVRREWELFEHARRINLPPNFRYYVMCVSCGHVGSPGWRNPSFLRVILQQSPLVRTACSACGSTQCRSMSEPEVRSEYFARLERNPEAGGPATSR